MDMNVASSAWALVEGRLLLPDGRGLSYAEYGSRAGYPVFVMHGAPSSRRSIHADMAVVAERLGVRVIVPERPGYGGSDVQPGRTLQDWSRDVQALSRALQLRNFSVVGYSIGGVYALACAHDLSEAIDRVAVVGGYGPFDEPQALEGMSPDVAGLFALAQSDPTALPGVLQPLATSPSALLQAMGASMPACDQTVLQERAPSYLADIAESLRQGVDGLAGDFVIGSQPWHFSPADIGTEVVWWHGELDQNAPQGMALRVTAQLRNGTCRMLAQEGHLVLASHWEDVLRGLLPS